MTYNELLNQKEWWSKCNEILNRDHYTCQDCGRLGFHNGGNYMTLSQINELDILLNKWRFNDCTLSEFIKNTCNLRKKRINSIIMEEVNNNKGMHIYCLPCVDGFDWDLMPGHLIAICEYEQSSLEAGYYNGRIITDAMSGEKVGRLLLFDFNSKLSNNLNVNVEYDLIGGLLYDGNNSPVHYLDINITWGTLFVSLLLSPYSCGIKSLNIHHKYYVQGSMPWEYPNDALITLCEDCHKKRHQETKVPLYNSRHQLIRNLIPCDRCGGSGYLPQYSHVEHGVCFKCGGEGVVFS
jgi:5-methylcytosine-specific restriction endonuclease McrA